VKAIRSEVENIAKIASDEMRQIMRHEHLLSEALDGHLWLSPEVCRSAYQLWSPTAESALLGTKEVLSNALSLKLALSPNTEVVPENDIRLQVITDLWEDAEPVQVSFSENELQMGMKEAKVKYDSDTFRAWKRARKRQKTNGG